MSGSDWKEPGHWEQSCTKIHNYQICCPQKVALCHRMPALLINHCHRVEFAGSSILCTVVEVLGEVKSVTVTVYKRQAIWWRSNWKELAGNMHEFSQKIDHKAFTHLFILIFCNVHCCSPIGWTPICNGRIEHICGKTHYNVTAVSKIDVSLYTHAMYMHLYPIL